MRLIIGDGLATEAMNVFTGSAFLVAVALLLKASNFEIGLLAALPTLTNVFQLISIWLVRRYNNRRAISVICSIFARLPLIMIGIFAFTRDEFSIRPIILFLFFYYFFGSIAGPSWNAWMKDLIPEKTLGRYFSRRSSYMQALNVCLSLGLALLINHIKKTSPANELDVYMWMFIAAGVIGIIGAIVLTRVPEPQSFLGQENIFSLLKRPLRDGNFRRLLLFNSAWVFALNIATPFFNVFMMKTLGLSLPYVIGLTIVSQLASILTIRIWGRYADRYSNKTIIGIGGPLYILCLIAWCFAGIFTKFGYDIALLVFIHIFSGIATAGINLSLTNIGLKLAPSNQSIVYLSAKNIVTAFFSSVAPLIGGILADYFTNRSLQINLTWTGPKAQKVFHLISLHEFNFLFLIGAVLAFIAVELLFAVKETGEVERDEVVRMMRTNIRTNLKEYFLIGHLITWQEQLWSLIRRKT
jgi:MFS family permease